MNWPDFVNGSFEALGGVFLAMNLRRILKDKKIAGISIFPVAFWSLWGFWNLFYYPHLGQWISFVGGVLVVTMNTIWVALAIWYSTRARHAR